MSKERRGHSHTRSCGRGLASIYDGYLRFHAADLVATGIDDMCVITYDDDVLTIGPPKNGEDKHTVCCGRRTKAGVPGKSRIICIRQLLASNGKRDIRLHRFKVIVDSQRRLITLNLRAAGETYDK
jgi:hypothetical protein